MPVLYSGHGITITRSGASDNYDVEYDLIDGTSSGKIGFEWDGVDMARLAAILDWLRSRAVEHGGYVAPPIASDANITVAFAAAFGV